MGLLKIDKSLVKRIYYKITGKRKPSIKMPPDSERKPYEIPEKGYDISVETALNSRCNSDYDNNQKKSHWGMFEKTLKISDTQVKNFLGLVKIPRFTHHRIEVQAAGNMLTFMMDKQLSGIQKEWAMIESGMQQQAVGLVSAALGIGMVFRSLGRNGHSVSRTDHANIKIKIDAMRPCYNGAYWSRSSPDGKHPLKNGNLPHPKREGNNSLITALAELRTRNTDAKPATDAMLSQLLWAARGRTPHWCQSNKWGLTIPTSKGKQHISSVYLLTNNKIHRYLNWHRNRPTHGIKFIRQVDRTIQGELQTQFSPSNCFIILTQNESYDSASWEVGYQLLNLLLQAHVLNISYEAILPDEDQKKIFQKSGAGEPAAIFGLSYESLIS
jgi:hypothetical protein